MNPHPRFQYSIFSAPDDGGGSIGGTDGVEDSGDTFAGDGHSLKDDTDPVGIAVLEDEKPLQTFDWEDSPESGYGDDVSSAAEGDEDTKAADDDSSGKPPDEGDIGLDPSMVQLAGEFGIDPGRAVLLHKNDLLSDAIRSEMGRIPQETGGDPLTGTQAETPVEVVKIDLGIDKDTLEPEMVAVLEKAQAAINSGIEQNTALQKQIADLNGGLQTQRIERFAINFDSKLANLGEDATKLIGTGPTSEMNKTTPEYQRRALIEGFYLDMVVGAETLGHTNDQQEMFDVIASGVLAKDANSLARKDLNDEVAKQAKQHTTRPTKRQTAERGDGTNTAIANVRAKLIDFGFDGSDYL